MHATCWKVHSLKSLKQLWIVITKQFKMQVLLPIFVFLLMASTNITSSKSANIFSKTKSFNLSTSDTIPFAAGGALLTFTNIPLGNDLSKLELKCIIPSLDGGNPTEVEPTVSNDLQKVLCRLPPEIASGRIDVSLEVLNTTTTSKASTQVYTSSNIVLPSPLPDLLVEESFDGPNQEIGFQWDPTHFHQFWPTGTPILLEMNIYISENGTSTFVPTDVRQGVGLNDLGFNKVNISQTTRNIMSTFRYPYFYIVRPAGSLSDIYLSSRLFTPTLNISNVIAIDTCAIWLATATPPPSQAETTPCPNCHCKAKIDQNFIEASYDPQIVKMAGGRLQNHKIYYERVPTSSGHAQTCSYNVQTDELRTDSPVKASWIHYVSKDISYVENYLSDIWPYIVCCLQTNTLQFCEAFHKQHRPVDTGHNYPGADEPCQGTGDPHMITFDGVRYDFMGFGEFWLIKGTGDFGVQGRMSPIAEGQKVSYYKAVVIKEGNSSVQIQNDNNGAMQIVVNKATLLKIPTKAMTIPLGDISISVNGAVVEVRAKTGFTIKVKHYATHLDVYGHGAQKNKGKGYMGIFGNFDGDTENDLTTREGFVIPPTAENLKNLSLLHHTFGISWLTTPEESYFLYEDGFDWNSYVNLTFGPLWETYPDPSEFSEAVRAICKENRACYYEYEGTGGDLEGAEDTARADEELEELKEEVAREIPMCEQIGSPENGKVTVEGYLNGSVARYTCGEEYELTGESTSTCVDMEGEEAGKVHWGGEEPYCLWTCTLCTDDMELVSTHDPSDCSKYFVCWEGVRYPQECPQGMNFNRETLVCDKDYECVGVPGC